MKKLKTNCSRITIIFFLFISSYSFAQTANDQSVKELPASTIVQLPITTQNTTDPNYEANIAKYKDFKEYIPVTDIIVKDEAYYLKEIQNMKNDIVAKEKIEAKSQDVLLKIENLKLELNLLENNYKKLIN